MSESMILAGGFPAQTHEDWQRLVAGVVNKSRAEDAKLAPADAEASLRTTLAGDLVIDPLYSRPADARPLGVPGEMPFTRGRALRDPNQPWDVRQLHDDPDAALTRAAVLDDLEHGATSVWLHVGADGIAPDAVAEALAEVRLDLAPVVVSSWDAQPAAADALLAVLRSAAGASGNLGHDPIGAAARTGATPDLSGLVGAIGGLDGLPEVRAITVDARVYRDAGASAVDEIAYAVATGIAYLRALAEAGIEAPKAFPHIEFRISATADQFLTIAALRALRALWARVGEVCGVPESERGARVHAVTATRMFTREDPWVNVLRSTIATFAACAGGADSITVLPYDTIAGLPEKFSRRLARNTQIVLADEANVGRVTDPAGGSYYVEDLTRDVATKAWAVVQEVESAGGMAVALANAVVAQRIQETIAEDGGRIATRRQPITGVSMFPLAGEQRLARRHRADVPTNDGALLPRRDAAAYEGLRDRSLAFAAQSGVAPSVALVALGGRRDFGARETFVTNLLAAGGIEASLFEGELAAADAAATNPSVAVIASSPKGYAAHAADAVATLREAGVPTLFVAGRAKELGGTTVDGEIYDGMDVVAFLSGLLDRLGAPAEGAL
ncbi:methylmalonyl-CoA mutase family protein [Nostocoides veronense]|uniref:Methylmalonyl-CoA mutase family protein n=1 Tax=Nostocoides veronense TaxID=330836 RepID=A0ABP4YC71_9MICO